MLTLTLDLETAFIGFVPKYYNPRIQFSKTEKLRTETVSTRQKPLTHKARPKILAYTLKRLSLIKLRTNAMPDRYN